MADIDLSIRLSAGDWIDEFLYIGDVSGGTVVIFDVRKEPDFGHLRQRAAMRGQAVHAERQKVARNNRRPHLRKET